VAAAYFFTSYARLDNNKYTKLGETVEELRERVRALIGAARVEDIGFFDLEEIKNGADWVQRLGHAVAKCRLLVCFCSNTYFNREVCGKEFEAFRQRLDGAAGDGRYVFPIIWDKCVLPKAIERFQADNKAIPREYFEDGLCCLRRLRRQAEYEITIEALARAIADAASDAPLPDGFHPIDFAALPSAFDNPGADAVRIAVLCDAGLLWEAQPGRTARACIEEATARDQVRWRQMDNGPGICLQLKGSALGNEPVILIVPEPTTVWRQRIADLDAALASGTFDAGAVLVGTKSVRGGVMASDAEGAVRTLFPAGIGSLRYFGSFEEAMPVSLVEKLRLAIYRLRASALISGDVARVHDPVLEASAASDGVPIANPAVLSASGGRP
jgi:hypothetical protein